MLLPKKKKKKKKNLLQPDEAMGRKGCWKRIFKGEIEANFLKMKLGVCTSNHCSPESPGTDGSGIPTLRASPHA